MATSDVTLPLQNAQRALKEGRMEEAVTLANAALAQAPDNVEALYVAAVAARYTNNWDAAQKTLSTLLTLSPEFGRGHQEIGHLARAQGDAESAIAAYTLATQFNPALAASWRAISDLTQQQNPPLAAAAKAQADRIDHLPPPLVTVTHLIAEGKFLRAEDLCRSYLKSRPKDVEGMRLLAEIGSRLNILDDADFLLESALVFEPDNIQVRLDYIGILRKRQKHEAALAQAEHLHQTDPQNPVFISHLAIETMQVGDYERALGLFDQVLSMRPGDPATLTSKGHALKTYGRHKEAVTAYQSAISSGPGHADAYYALANLKTYRFTDDEVAAMTGQIENPLHPVQAKVHFHFALGKAHEDREDYDASFRHYRDGNALKRQQSRYDADQMAAEFEAVKAACPADLFDRRTGADAPDPIFIVGLPRAGSTLLEQILASHPDVDGTMELPNILSLAHKLRTRAPQHKGEKPYPDNLAHLSAEELLAFGEDYIEKTKIHRQGAPYFIDKMPNNFRHIGLIHLILPNAKIIDARRAPLDCCFSGFKQLFAEGQEFTYGLDEIGRYYHSYVELMRHWDTVLPGRVLHVQHEDVIDDLEHHVRRILDFCELPFDSACVEFHRTQRSVRTASSEQVRQPISRKGMGQWRPFEPWLDPLKAALGSSLTEYRP